MSAIFLVGFVFIDLFHITVCENTSLKSNTYDRKEVPHAVKIYVDNIVSELSGHYESRIAQLQSEVALHKHDTDETDELIKELQNEVNIQREEIKKLQEKQHEDKYTIVKNKNRLDKIERKFSRINIKGQESVFSENEDKNISMKQLERGTKSVRLQNCLTPEGNEIKRFSTDTRVAFFAQMTSHSTNLRTHQVIVFDHEVTNIGNAYDAKRGIFMAPIAGTYMFSVTLGHYESGALSANGHGMVMVNGIVVAWLYMLEEQSSQTIVVQLKTGDEVLVQNLVSGQGIYGELYSTFSGFLLYADDSSNSFVG